MATRPGNVLAENLDNSEHIFLKIMSPPSTLVCNEHMLRFQELDSKSDTTIELANPDSECFCYFEVKILNAFQSGGVFIGVGRTGYSAKQIPGQRPLSVSFSCRDGNLYHGSRKPQPYASPCASGDTIGCGVDYGPASSLRDGGKEEVELSVRVWFTKNGEAVGPPVTTTKPVGGFCSLIGLLSHKDHVQYLGHKAASPPYVEKPLRALPICLPEKMDDCCEVVFPCRNNSNKAELSTKPCDIITINDWGYSTFWAKGTLNDQVGLFYKGFVKFAKKKVEPVKEAASSEGHSITYCNRDFVVLEKPESWLSCNICLQLPKDPQISKCCAHSFCLKCCETWTLRKQTPSCPLCRASPFEVIVDPRSVRSIKALTACCPNAPKGCAWRGNIPAAHLHLTVDCPLVPVKCPNKCGTDLVRGDLPEHRSLRCTKAKIQCPCCSQYILNQAGEKVFMSGLIKYDELINTHHLSCPAWPVHCPNGCTTSDHLTRSKVAHHLQNECPLSLIPCPCKGCSDMIKRKDKESHLLDSSLMPLHFYSLLNEVEDMRVQLANVVFELKLYKQKVAELEMQAQVSTQ